jgi:hypothetical protein
VVANQAVDTVSVLLNRCEGAGNPGCGVETDCDDGDPCSQDLCDGGYCAFPDAPDFIACALANSLDPPACAGDKVPGGFRKKFGRAARAVELLLAGNLSEKKEARAQKKADAGLAGAAKAIDKAETRRKQPLSAECVAALRALLTRAQASVPAPS